MLSAQQRILLSNYVKKVTLNSFKCLRNPLKVYFWTYFLLLIISTERYQIYHNIIIFLDKPSICVKRTDR